MRKAALSKYRHTLRNVEVIYIYGPPGTGKSTYVWDNVKNTSFYQPPPIRDGKIWFDGYTGQDVLWLEDMVLNTLSRDLILRILDKFPLLCEVKGGTTYACWTKVYITSNQEPEYLEEAVQRRFTDVIFFDGGYSDTSLDSINSVKTDGSEPILRPRITNGGAIR